MAALEKRALTKSEIVTSSWGAVQPEQLSPVASPLRSQEPLKTCATYTVGRGVARWWVFARHVQGLFLQCHKEEGESRGERAERPGGRDTGVEWGKKNMSCKF